MTVQPIRMTERRGESELLAAARSRDLTALGELYARHSDMVYSAARRILGTAQDAEDVLQDVFVGLPRALAAYHERGRFVAWLRQVTVRTALMRRRSSDRKREAPLDHTTLAAPASHSPLDRIALERALARLPDALRLVFVLKEIEGYSHAEIGALLGISAASSSVRLSRAWSALRREIHS
jgi:RNA polymerase sigma-70 factor (ECF subfamily)